MDEVKHERFLREAFDWTNRYEQYAYYAYTWAEGTLRQVGRYLDAKRAFENAEYASDKAVAEEANLLLVDAQSAVFVESHLLVVAAQQMRAWADRLERHEAEDGSPPPSVPSAEPRLLKDLRNTVEHLADTYTGPLWARRDPQDSHRGSRSVERMPEGKIDVSPWAADKVFGVIDVDDLRRDAQRLARELAQTVTQMQR